MPGYGWYRLKHRLVAAAWLICTLWVGWLTFWTPWPWWIRGIGIAATLMMVLLLAVDHSDDRQEQRALEDYRAALERWRRS